MANYLTFASAEPFTIAVSNATKNWDGTLCYSTDSATWNEWDGTTAIASAEHGGEQRIYMRGSANSVITGNIAGVKWVLTGNEVRCSGNIETILDYDKVARDEHPEMGHRCFYNMFYQCSCLITAPELPAITLGSCCYESMFESCSGLKTAPALPAITLTHWCYSRMFYGCTSLTIPPALPATTLAEQCYGWMFKGCTSLNAIPELPATTLPDSCYISMFNGCTGIKLSKTQTDEYTTEYRIPTSGTGTTELGSMNGMFSKTGGSLVPAQNPPFNTTFYTANRVIPAVTPEEPSAPFEPDPFSVTLGWLVGSRIAGQRGKA